MEPENVGFGRCFFFWGGFLTFSVSVRPLFSKAPWFALKAIIGQLVGALDLEGFSHIEMGFTTWNDSKNPWFVV